MLSWRLLLNRRWSCVGRPTIHWLIISLNDAQSSELKLLLIRHPLLIGTPLIIIKASRAPLFPLIKVVVQLEYFYILPKRFIVSLHIATYSLQLVYLPPPLLPVTLHCSDGVVRSGTFLVIHSQLERLKTEGVVDVFQAVKSARIQRPGVIPNIVCFNIISLLVRGVPSFHCK